MAKKSLPFTIGDLWKRQRLLLGNPFHFQSLKNRIPIIKSLSTEVINGLPTGAPVPIIKFC